MIRDIEKASTSGDGAGVKKSSCDSVLLMLPVDIVDGRDGLSITRLVYEYSGGIPMLPTHGTVVFRVSFKSALACCSSAATCFRNSVYGRWRSGNDTSSYPLHSLQYISKSDSSRISKPSRLVYSDDSLWEALSISLFLSGVSSLSRDMTLFNFFSDSSREPEGEM